MNSTSLTTLMRNLVGWFKTLFREPTPDVLYHYTKWDGAQGILTSKQIWATSHDCTNDPAELSSAGEVIVTVARDIRGKFAPPAWQTIIQNQGLQRLHPFFFLVSRRQETRIHCGRRAMGTREGACVSEFKFFTMNCRQRMGWDERYFGSTIRSCRGKKGLRAVFPKFVLD